MNSGNSQCPRLRVPHTYVTGRVNTISPRYLRGTSSDMHPSKSRRKQLTKTGYTRPSSMSRSIIDSFCFHSQTRRYLVFLFRFQLRCRGTTSRCARQRNAEKNSPLIKCALSYLRSVRPSRILSLSHCTFCNAFYTSCLTNFNAEN